MNEYENCNSLKYRKPKTATENHVKRTSKLNGSHICKRVNKSERTLTFRVVYRRVINNDMKTRKAEMTIKRNMTRILILKINTIISPAPDKTVPSMLRIPSHTDNESEHGQAQEKSDERRYSITDLSGEIGANNLPGLSTEPTTEDG